MREKIGDWFLDVAKYIATAFLLSSLFSDLDSTAAVAGVLCTFTVTFAAGFYLAYKKDKKERNEI